MRTTEFTRPLSGKPYYSSTGIIQAVDKNDVRFSVAEISYERFDDQNFQYVFSPYWDTIDNMPSSIFMGIPGIDLDVRKEHYYRVNMTPSFIEMRSPSENREDLWELLAEVGLDYYDRFEWLLRTDKTCGDDNLIVVRKREEKKIYYDTKLEDLNDIQPMDEIRVSDFSDITKLHKDASYVLFWTLTTGASILQLDSETYLSDADRRLMLYTLFITMNNSEKYVFERQKAGIAKAKQAGKYKGRKKMTVDPLLLEKVSRDFHAGVISEAEAMAMLEIKSRSTFYRRLKENILIATSEAYTVKNVNQSK